MPGRGVPNWRLEVRVFEMVRTNCGSEGHYIKVCPKLKEADLDHAMRGKRDAPRTPGPSDASELANLAGISKKLSPKPLVPPIPGVSDVSGSNPDANGTQEAPVTLSAIAGLLDEKLGPMRSDDIKQIDAQVQNLAIDFSEMKASTESKVDALRMKMDSEIGALSAKVGELQSHGIPRSVDEALAQRVSDPD